MSDTPETDVAILESNGQWSFVLKECCQRLERERDQWRECADKLAEALFYELSGTMTIGGKAHIALEELYRLKEKSK